MDLKTSNKSIVNNYVGASGSLVDKCSSLEDNDRAQRVLHSNVHLDFKSGHENDPNLIQENEQHLISSNSESNSPLMSTSSSSKVLKHYKSESTFGQALNTLEPCPIYSFISKKETNLFPNSISKLSTLYQPLALPNGQIKVVLRLNLANKVQNGSSFVKISSSNRHLALYDPLYLTSNQSNSQPTQSPKIFAFDAILDTQDPQHYQALNKETLPELINTVINGHNAALISLGTNGLHEAMFNSNGLMIHALSWLFAAIKTCKKQYTMKCTSAQISGKDVIDLLNPTKPCRKCLLKSQSKSNSILDQLHEVLCGCVKKAARCLDKIKRQYRLQDNLNLFIFTIHLNQIESFRSRDGKTKELSTRCKLHLLDFSSSAETLSDILLGISKRQKHGNQINNMAMALQECLSSVMKCTFVANDFGQSYQEMLESCQSMNRIYKSRLISLTLSNCDSTSMIGIENKLTRADKEHSDCEGINHWYTPSSDHSIDTVIFCGNSLPKLNTGTVIKRNETQSPNLSVSSEPCTKCVNIKPDLNFDGHLSDGSKKSKRKKFWLKPFKEIWIDDTNMTKNEKVLASIDPDDIELFNRDQRVRNWIKDYTKMVQSKKEKCDCAKSKASSPTPLLQVNLNQIEALNKKAKHTKQCQVNQLNINYPNKTEKCDLSKCRKKSNRCDQEKCCICDVPNSLALTELPKQLKLEQFLQQLSTITDPKSSPGSSKCSNLKSLNHITNYSLSNDQLINFENKNESPLIHRYKEECNKDVFTSPKRPPSVRVLSPGSTFSYNLNSSEIILPSTPQVKRTTNSTSTSGHGTTSEGDDRSKKSIEWSLQTKPRQLKVDFQPGSSDYESVVQDEESEFGEERGKDKSKSSKSNNQITNGDGKVRQKQKDKQMIKKYLSESKKEILNLDSDSISESNKCSLFCCKFIDFS